ncbi:MAG TPA: hypothetical protein VK436_03575 [Methanocella sp.]|nr:hypothetical protein [Methanocella sp.]
MHYKYSNASVTGICDSDKYCGDTNIDFADSRPTTKYDHAYHAYRKYYSDRFPN